MDAPVVFDEAATDAFTRQAQSLYSVHGIEAAVRVEFPDDAPYRCKMPPSLDVKSEMWDITLSVQRTKH